MTTRLPTKALIGRRIRLILTTLPELQAGSMGVVKHVDEAGQVHVDWDNGRNDVLTWASGDRWMIVPDSVSHA